MPQVVEVRGQPRVHPSTSRSCCSPSSARARVLGSSRIRGFAALLHRPRHRAHRHRHVTGQQRLTFGTAQLADGIDVVVVAVGIFAVGEALWVAAHLRRKAADVIPVGRPWMGRADWGRSWKPWLRGTALGFPFGALPAGGAEIPTFLSYMTERKLSKRPEEFGKGAIEGVAGPEAANNASAAGTLVPMLALGLPTNATAAIMLAALQGYGIEPGPLLLDKQPVLVWTLIASLFIGNTMLLAAQPAARPGLGQAAPDPASLPLRRHPLLRLHGCVCRQRPAVRPAPAARAGHARLRDAPLRTARAAAHHRRHPRPARRAAAAALAPDSRAATSAVSSAAPSPGSASRSSPSCWSGRSSAS